MSDPHDYSDDTTAELIKCLQVGAAVLATDHMIEFPEMMLACAQRMTEMRDEMAKPVPQPNSQGMTPWESGYAARCAELHKAVGL